jgi:hypothetical protein
MPFRRAALACSCAALFFPDLNPVNSLMRTSVIAGTLPLFSG